MLNCTEVVNVIRELRPYLQVYTTSNLVEYCTSHQVELYMYQYHT